MQHVHVRNYGASRHTKDWRRIGNSFGAFHGARRTDYLRIALRKAFVFAHSQNCEKRLLTSSCLSVCPLGTTRLILDGFSWNFIIEYYLKICRENSSFRTGLWGNLHEDLCTFSIISGSVLRRMRRVSDKRFRENHNTFCIQYYIFFRKSCRLRENVKKKNIADPGRSQITI
jgi:hypothetical protein